MTDRSIWARISDAYIAARDFYRETRADIECIAFKCYRGAVVLVLLAFGAGVWIG